MDTDSIFDLSPPEKLQLVEDLWDDLAATPSEVPIHDWQKEELARRKASLMSKPASGLSWEEVQARIRSRYGLLTTKGEKQCEPVTLLWQR